MDPAQGGKGVLTAGKHGYDHGSFLGDQQGDSVVTGCDDDDQPGDKNMGVKPLDQQQEEVSRVVPQEKTGTTNNRSYRQQ